MTDIAERMGMLHPAQFGFRQGRSTVDAVYVLTTLLSRAKAKS